MGLRSYKAKEEIEIGDIVVMKKEATETAFSTCIITGIRDGYAWMSRPHLRASDFDTKGAFVALENYEVSIENVRASWLVFDRNMAGDKDNRRMR